MSGLLDLSCFRFQNDYLAIYLVILLRVLACWLEFVLFLYMQQIHLLAHFFCSGISPNLHAKLLCGYSIPVIQHTALCLLRKLRSFASLFQVVGRKYVRLYCATLSEELYPYNESMLKNSSQVSVLVNPALGSNHFQEVAIGY